ncbi:MAG: hypothetical protein R6U61_07485 [Thermoplasmata archaeon]
MNDQVKERNREQESIPEEVTSSSGAHWENEIVNVLQDIETDYSQFKDNIQSLRRNLQGFMEETEEKLAQVRSETSQKAEKKEITQNVSRVKSEISDMDEKLTDVMDEVGYGESLDVSKIPPVILKEVYESTLEDAVIQMRENLGEHDAQQVIQSTLEMMRTRTSGSELFQYDGRKIHVRNLINSINRNLISAKQIHSTYTELMNKFRESLPGYEPKNFRAMMKSKSLEFSIDKTTQLLDRVDKIEKNLESTSNILSSFTNQFNQRIQSMKQQIDHMEEHIDEKIEEEISAFDERLGDMEERISILDDLRESIQEMREFNQEKEEIRNEVKELSAAQDLQVSRLEDEIAELRDEEPKRVPEPELTDEERFVYFAIPADGGTLNSVEKSVEDVVDDVEGELDDLIEKGLVKKFKRGRWNIYQRLEEGLEGGEVEENEDVIEIQDEEEMTEEDLEGEMEEVLEEVKEFEKNGVEEDEGEVEDVDEVEEDVEGEIEEGTEEVEGEIEETEKVEEVEERDEFDIVLSNITEDGSTLSRLNREIEELDEDEIESVLEELIDQDRITTEKRNRWTIYLKATKNQEVK